MAAPDALSRFRAAAADLGLDVDVTHYPEGTRTAMDAADAIGCAVGQIVKSLVFVGSGGVVLALTSGANRVDTVALGEIIGGEVKRADADLVRSATGFSIGGTPPFAHPAPIPTFVDRDLLGHDTVWAAAGTPDTVFAIEPRRLVDLCGGTVADFADRGD